MKKTFILKNKLSEVRTLATAVFEFGKENNLSREIMHDVNLTLEELLANVIFYGYKDKKEHEILIHLTLEKKELILQFEDDGVPFNPLEFPIPDMKKLQKVIHEGGMGIHFVRSLMDEIKYKRKQGKNILLMKKKI